MEVVVVAMKLRRAWQRYARDRNAVATAWPFRPGAAIPARIDGRPAIGAAADGAWILPLVAMGRAGRGKNVIRPSGTPAFHSAE